MNGNASSMYTLEQLKEAYELSDDRARMILGAVGATRTDVDVFMRAYRNRKAAEIWFMDTATPPAR